MSNRERCYLGEGVTYLSKMKKDSASVKVLNVMRVHGNSYWEGAQLYQQVGCPNNEAPKMTSQKKSYPPSLR